MDCKLPVLQPDFRHNFATWRNFFLLSLSCLEFEWKVIFKSNLSQHFQSTNFDWNREKLTQTLGKWAEELEGIQQSCPTNLNSEEWGCWTTSIWIHTTELTRFEEILNIENKEQNDFQWCKAKGSRSKNAWNIMKDLLEGEN